MTKVDTTVIQRNNNQIKRCQGYYRNKSSSFNASYYNASSLSRILNDIKASYTNIGENLNNIYEYLKDFQEDVEALENKMSQNAYGYIKVSSVSSIVNKSYHVIDKVSINYDNLFDNITSASFSSTVLNQENSNNLSKYSYTPSEIEAILKKSATNSSLSQKEISFLKDYYTSNYKMELQKATTNESIYKKEVDRLINIDKRMVGYGYHFEDLETYAKTDNQAAKLLASSGFKSYKEYQKALLKAQKNLAMATNTKYLLEQNLKTIKYSFDMRNTLYNNYQTPKNISKTKLDKYVVVSDDSISINYKKYCEENGDTNPYLFFKSCQTAYKDYVTVSGIDNVNKFNDLYEASKVNPNLEKYYLFSYEKNGLEKADEFMMDMQDEINKTVGEVNAGAFLDGLANMDTEGALSAVTNHVQVSGKGLATGVEGWFSNVGEFLTGVFTNKENRVYSKQEYENMFILQALVSKDEKLQNGLISQGSTGSLKSSSKIIDYTKNYDRLLKHNYQISQSIGNMLPSMAITCATGTVLGASGFSASAIKASTSFASSMSIGLSAAGGSYHSAMVEGYDKDKSLFYGAVSGTSEALSEKFLGAIPILSDVEVSSLKTWFQAMGKEGMEEFLQTYIGAGVDTAILKKKVDLKDTTGEAIQSGVYGAVTGGIMQSPSLVLNSVRINQLNKAIQTGVIAESDAVSAIHNLFPNTQNMNYDEITSTYLNKSTDSKLETNKSKNFIGKASSLVGMIGMGSRKGSNSSSGNSTTSSSSTSKTSIDTKIEDFLNSNPGLREIISQSKEGSTLYIPEDLEEAYLNFKTLEYQRSKDYNLFSRDNVQSLVANDSEALKNTNAKVSQNKLLNVFQKIKDIKLSDIKTLLKLNSNRQNDFSFKTLVDMENRKTEAITVGDLKQSIIENMPEGLSELEKARYAYLELGKRLNFDENLNLHPSEDVDFKIYNDHKAITDESLIINKKVICASWSKIYQGILNSLGIESQVGDAHHMWVEFKINDSIADDIYLIADATTGATMDLAKIKKGESTLNFKLIDHFSDGESIPRISRAYESISSFEEIIKSIDKKLGYLNNNNYNTYVDDIVNTNDNLKTKLENLSLKGLGFVEAKSLLVDFVSSLSADEKSTMSGADLVKLQKNNKVDVINITSLLQEDGSYKYYGLHENLGLKEISKTDIDMLLASGYKLQKDKNINGYHFNIANGIYANFKNIGNEIISNTINKFSQTEAPEFQNIQTVNGMQNVVEDEYHNLKKLLIKDTIKSSAILGIPSLIFKGSPIGIAISAIHNFFPKFYFESINTDSKVWSNIKQNGLYHFTTEENANKILESGYIKASNKFTSYDLVNRTFFFNGVPNFISYVNDLGGINEKAIAIKIDVNDVDANNFSRRTFGDQAITYSGNYTLDKNKASLAYFGLMEENGKLVYKEISKEVYDTYKTDIHDMNKFVNIIDSAVLTIGNEYHKMYRNLKIVKELFENAKLSQNVKSLATNLTTNFDSIYQKTGAVIKERSFKLDSELYTSKIEKIDSIVNKVEAKLGKDVAMTSLLDYYDTGDINKVLKYGGLRSFVEKQVSKQDLANYFDYNIKYNISNDKHTLNSLSSFYNQFTNKEFGASQESINNSAYYVYNGQKYTYYEMKSLISKFKKQNLSLPHIEKVGNSDYFKLKQKLIDRGFSSQDASVILTSIDDAGACTYASTCNSIFYEFKDNPNEFKNIFGYDMYILEDGKVKLNDKELLLDLYVFANSKENGGNFIINSKLNPDYISKTVDVYGRNILKSNEQVYFEDSVNGRNNKLISDFLKSKNKYLSYDGLTLYKNLNAETARDFPVAINALKNCLNKGYSATMDYFYNPKNKQNKPVTLYAVDPSYKNASSLEWGGAGGHSITITNVLNDHLEVSSWGKKYYVPFNELINNASFMINVGKLSSQK